MVQLELFGDIFEYFLPELLFLVVTAHDGIPEIVSAHFVHEHAEGDPLAGKLSRRHIFEEFIDLCCFITCVRALDNFKKFWEFDHA